MRKLILMVAVFMAVGCATPPGQLKKSDLVWQKKKISAKYQEVYRRMKKGFRHCAVDTVQSDLYTDNKTGHLDVYLYGRPLIFGFIDIKFISETSTWIKIGVLNRYDTPFFREEGYYRKKWLRWASGDLSC